MLHSPCCCCSRYNPELVRKEHCKNWGVMVHTFMSHKPHLFVLVQNGTKFYLLQISNMWSNVSTFLSLMTSPRLLTGRWMDGMKSKSQVLTWNRLPIAPDILLGLKEVCLQHQSTRDAAMLWATSTMCLLGFLGEDKFDPRLHWRITMSGSLAIKTSLH